MTAFGFIGTGHLGSMLVKKFVETGAIEAEEILASNRTQEKVQRLAKATGIRPASSRVVAELSDVIFICVRPLEVRDVLSELAYLLDFQKLVVSVAADVSLENMGALCPARLARAFPSMASEKLQGATLLAFGDNATREDRGLIVGLFQAIGKAEVVEEKDFGTLADLTSCAPGYFAALMREFVLAAERREISAELAERLVKQTLLGTAMLLEEESFAGLIKSVATKGGITEAGVKVIEREAPGMFDQLFQTTQARHEQVMKNIEGQR
ncbi:MAG: NAD(P)-binding domain-containing protein [Methanotrichaceae archaeon]|nr:NAD(P)-binding domain-containing protein [Methanotrichaceae archaeon]